MNLNRDNAEERKKTMKLGMDDVSEAYELAKRIAHPENNGLVKMYKMYMENPSAHTVYLLHDVVYVRNYQLITIMVCSVG